MSFYYNKTKITLDNYKTIFADCIPDILDEIRNAIYDDTDISAYINVCGNDSYKLNQIRLAIREDIPMELISVNMTAHTIYQIRNIIRKGYDTTEISRYLYKGNLRINPMSFETIVDFMYLKVDTSKIDFVQIPNDYVLDVCKALKDGYPMWFIDYDVYQKRDKKYLEALIKCMKLRIDIMQFMNDDRWTSKQILTFCKYAKAVQINEMLGIFTPQYLPNEIDLILKLAKDGFPYISIAEHDQEGFPIYNEYQMIVLDEAIRCDCITANMYNTYLSDSEMEGILEKNKRLKNIS